MKSVEITVDAEGAISIEAVGFKGASCDKATVALEAALGKIKRKDRKPEYVERTAQNVRH